MSSIQTKNDFMLINKLNEISQPIDLKLNHFNPVKIEITFPSEYFPYNSQHKHPRLRLSVENHNHH